MAETQDGVAQNAAPQGAAPNDIHFLLITGLSGAGKTAVLRAFEDEGYFCVDNLPPALIPKFAELCRQSGGRVDRVALVCDVRSGEFFNQMFEALAELERTGFVYTILFLEASNEALIRRFKETRRRHPLAPDGGILEGIEAERARLEQLRGRSDYLIDTSDLSPKQLRDLVRTTVVQAPDRRRLGVSVVSFGFKHGVPMDVDLLFDVRFMPNPHYVPSLRPRTGKDQQVIDYVFQWPLSEKFIEKVTDLLAFLMPNFVNEGKSHLVIGVGCTGGRHRSVAVADRIGAFLQDLGYRVSVRHRDIERPPGPLEEEVAGSQAAQARAQAQAGAQTQAQPGAEAQARAQAQA